ncbi:hypothetical protein CASFOL_007199 [Castilleja foliolosa]|uniref:GATA transcription factor n=1 Tax=Castilleja foliolosa TaxID=1961234 RepID=A0ABD3E8R0_9LAMI
MEAPEFFQTTSYYSSQFNTEKKLSDPKNSDHFIIDDLLNFPNDETMVADDGVFEAAMAATSTDSSAVTVVENSHNSSFSDFQAAGIGDAQFTSELCVPYDEVLELEWLSTFVDESFPSEDLQKLHLIQGMKARTNEPSETHQYQFQPETTHLGPLIPTEMSVPAKARSKRSRSAPENWTSRLLVVSPPPIAAVPAMSSSSESEVAPAKKPVAHKKKEAPAAENNSSGGNEGRRCFHCATDKTPQWRTGPMGPKTLCNACGVRYKSGRLVPEYRPAASPTFVLTKHSNSHRKVLELRRQKEMQRAQQHQQQFLHHHHHQNMMFDVSNGDDYLIHQHIGPDYRQMI